MDDPKRRPSSWNLGCTGSRADRYDVQNVNHFNQIRPDLITAPPDVPNENMHAIGALLKFMANELVDSINARGKIPRDTLTLNAIAPFLTQTGVTLGHGETFPAAATFALSQYIVSPHVDKKNDSENDFSLVVVAPISLSLLDDVCCSKIVESYGQVSDIYLTIILYSRQCVGGYVRRDERLENYVQQEYKERNDGVARFVMEIQKMESSYKHICFNSNAYQRLVQKASDLGVKTVFRGHAIVMDEIPMRAVSLQFLFIITVYETNYSFVCFSLVLVLYNPACVF